MDAMIGPAIETFDPIVDITDDDNNDGKQDIKISLPSTPPETTNTSSDSNDTNKKENIDSGVVDDKQDQQPVINDTVSTESTDNTVDPTTVIDGQQQAMNKTLNFGKKRLFGVGRKSTAATAAATLSVDYNQTNGTNVRSQSTSSATSGSGGHKWAPVVANSSSSGQLSASSDAGVLAVNGSNGSHKSSAANGVNGSSTTNTSEDRFVGEGIQFNAKLIGHEFVAEARGEQMCQQSLKKLKILQRGLGGHKRKIHLFISFDGIKIRDAQTSELIYHHSVPQISFISRDESDSRSFGYVFGSSSTGHQFIALRTQKEALPIMSAIGQLFTATLRRKRFESLNNGSPNDIWDKDKDVSVTAQEDRSGGRRESSSTLRPSRSESPNVPSMPAPPPPLMSHQPAIGSALANSHGQQMDVDLFSSFEASEDSVFGSEKIPMTTTDRSAIVDDPFARSFGSMSVSSSDWANFDDDSPTVSAASVNPSPRHSQSRNSTDFPIDKPLVVRLRNTSGSGGDVGRRSAPNSAQHSASNSSSSAAALQSMFNSTSAGHHYNHPNMSPAMNNTNILSSQTPSPGGRRSSSRDASGSSHNNSAQQMPYNTPPPGSGAVASNQSLGGNSNTSSQDRYACFSEIHSISSSIFDSMVDEIAAETEAELHGQQHQPSPHSKSLNSSQNGGVGRYYHQQQQQQRPLSTSSVTKGGGHHSTTSTNTNANHFYYSFDNPLNSEQQRSNFLYSQQQNQDSYHNLHNNQQNYMNTNNQIMANNYQNLQNPNLPNNYQNMAPNIYPGTNQSTYHHLQGHPAGYTQPANQPLNYREYQRNSQQIYTNQQNSGQYYDPTTNSNQSPIPATVHRNSQQYYDPSYGGQQSPQIGTEYNAQQQPHPVWPPTTMGMANGFHPQPAANYRNHSSSSIGGGVWSNTPSSSMSNSSQLSGGSSPAPPSIPAPTPPPTSAFGGSDYDINRSCDALNELPTVFAELDPLGKDRPFVDKSKFFAEYKQPKQPSLRDLNPELAANSPTYEPNELTSGHSTDPNYPNVSYVSQPRPALNCSANANPFNASHTSSVVTSVCNDSRQSFNPFAATDIRNTSSVSTPPSIPPTPPPSVTPPPPPRPPSRDCPPVPPRNDLVMTSSRSTQPSMLPKPPTPDLTAPPLPRRRTVYTGDHHFQQLQQQRYYQSYGFDTNRQLFDPFSSSAVAAPINTNPMSTNNSFISNNYTANYSPDNYSSTAPPLPNPQRKVTPSMSSSSSPSSVAIGRPQPLPRKLSGKSSPAYDPFNCAFVDSQLSAAGLSSSSVQPQTSSVFSDIQVLSSSQSTPKQQMSANSSTTDQLPNIRQQDLKLSEINSRYDWINETVDEMTPSTDCSMSEPGSSTGHHHQRPSSGFATNFDAVFCSPESSTDPFKPHKPTKLNLNVRPNSEPPIGGFGASSSGFDTDFCPNFAAAFDNNNSHKDKDNNSVVLLEGSGGAIAPVAAPQQVSVADEVSPPERNIFIVKSDPFADDFFASN